MNDEMPSRNVGTFHLDTNLICARGKNKCVKNLERWVKNNVINLDMSRTAYNEAQVNNKLRKKKTISKFIWIQINYDPDDEYLKLIERILFPSGAKNQNQINDVVIVYTARQVGAMLISNEGNSNRQRKGILGNAERLKEIGVYVWSAKKAVLKINDLIQKRDILARQVAEEQGLALPRWVGKDNINEQKVKNESSCR